MTNQRPAFNDWLEAWLNVGADAVIALAAHEPNSITCIQIDRQAERQTDGRYSRRRCYLDATAPWRLEQHVLWLQVTVDNLMIVQQQQTPAPSPHQPAPLHAHSCYNCSLANPITLYDTIQRTICAFSALTLLAGRHPACKPWVMRCWCGYLSAVRCRLFAHGPADATASQTPIISCLKQLL